MTDKEKYTILMQRYWEAETTPAEERDLARYVARVDDPDFDELRGVLGYLSVDCEKRARQARAVRICSFAAVAACLVAVAVFGLNLRPRRAGDLCVRYAYGVQTTDNGMVLSDVETSLADFFAGDTPAETNLINMFQR